MAKPNYSFEKRQRELAKKKKREEKLQNKRNKANDEQQGTIADHAEDSTDNSS